MPDILKKLLNQAEEVHYIDLHFKNGIAQVDLLPDAYTLPRA